MKPRLLLGVLCCLFICALPTRADEALRAKLLDFERRALFTREIETKLQNIPRRSPRLKDDGTRQAALLKLSREYAEKPIPADAIARDFFVYYGAYLQMLADETASARATFAGLIGSPTMTAEALVNYQKLDSAPGYEHLKSKERSRLFREMQGKLLPVGYYGRAYDLANHRPMSFHDPILRFHRFDTDGHYSQVGRAEWGRSGRIAEAFVQMKLHRWATIASFEILYANPLHNLQQARSWIYKTPTIHWDAIAQAHWQLGNEEQLAGALARVIVFGYNGVKDDALKILIRWREEGLPKQPEAAQPDAEQLKLVISLYAEMNMHPRSFELLREFGDVIGPQAVELREKYEKEWPGKVRLKPSLPDGYLVFGQEVDTPEKRLNMTIPPPLRPEVIAEVKQRVLELETGSFE